MTALVLVVSAIALAGAWVYVRARLKYAPLFQDAHFRELVDCLPALKSSVLEHVGQPMQPPNDPRIVQTSARVTILWTAEELRDTGLLLNHLSLSRAGAYLTWAAGGRFSYVILRQLGIPLQQAAVALGPSGVVHLAFLVPRKSKDSFYDAPVPTLPEDLTQTKEEAGQFMTETMRSGRLLRDETQLLPALMGAA